MSLIFLSVLFIVMVSLRFMTTWPLIQREISDSVYTFSVIGFIILFWRKFSILKKKRPNPKKGLLHCRVASDTDIRNSAPHMLWIDHLRLVRTKAWVVAVDLLLFRFGHVRLAVSLSRIFSQVEFTTLLNHILFK